MLEPQRGVERRRGSERGREEGRLRTRDRDRLQHLTGCPGEPLKVIERERERKTHMERERGELERDAHCSNRVIKKTCRLAE